MSGDDELDKLLFSVSRSPKKKNETDSARDPQVEDAAEPDNKTGSGQDLGFDPLDLVDLDVMGELAVIHI